MSTTRRMHLVAYLKTGPTANHVGAWRHPAADLDDHLRARAVRASRARAGSWMFRLRVLCRHLRYPRSARQPFPDLCPGAGRPDQLPRSRWSVLPLMARVTSRLGLGATLSTTFQTPYYLARTLASLDLLSKGRIAWNVVTSAIESRGAQFRPGRDTTQGPALRTRRRGAGGLLRAVGLLGRRRAGDGARTRPVRGRIESALRQLRRQIRAHPRAAGDAALAASAPGVPTGGRLIAWTRFRRTLGGDDLLHAAHQGGLPRIPR